MTVASVLGRLRAAGAHRISAVGVATATGAATVALGLVPGPEPSQAAQAAPAAGAPVELTAPATGAGPLQQGALAERSATAYQEAQAEALEEERKPAARQSAGTDGRATRSADRPARARERAASYPDNLDGWIREALAVMKREGIPGSYAGIHRNIIRESSGDPRAINNWDINARNGIPSKGLLQVIPPTFAAYHVEGTSWDIYDPVANITAACNYAADRYGSMDNVYSAY
ncbi:transglycosylase SLT domain-containing protein [Streptomyces sp. TRM 70361]|uniref:transglycosylase SLT domain-containing protein n=1 Tax=Streptomyces sp. TRM 70361 TaxID=3116553 RepID=UPI002E7B6C5E|nr:transglycosylase SLT domain-containing protein [Streptomyces sp. TRM 70361]MEE1942456.1 transglycosylase SLT domain-containing protein [Streptomyces sp. TRM 70361]